MIRLIICSIALCFTILPAGAQTSVSHVPPEMATVQSGTFIMGKQTGMTPKELSKRYYQEPQEYIEPDNTHQVTISRNYKIAKYETTVAQAVEVFNWAIDHMYARIVKDKQGTRVINSRGQERVLFWIYFVTDVDWKNPDAQANEGRLSAKAGRESRALIAITWFGAACYCNWLSEMKGRTPCFDLDTWECNFKANGYRLPTEAEWEFAARGGNQSQGYVFSGSNDLDKVAWDTYNSFLRIGDSTYPVGKKAPNELGIHDMSGNAKEWCFDWMMDYVPQAQTDPAGPTTGKSRVMRGGSCTEGGGPTRVVARFGDWPENWWLDRGFRVALTQ
jgi:formylglycine-generating enzyme